MFYNLKKKNPERQHIESCKNKVDIRYNYFLCSRCQTLEHVSEANEELLDAGPADRRECDSAQSPEADLPSLCLKQVFPKYAKQFNYLRLVDRVAALFIRFLGVKGTTKLGPTGFRTFIRLVR